jgi:hypothetical protein
MLTARSDEAEFYEATITSPNGSPYKLHGRFSRLPGRSWPIICPAKVMYDVSRNSETDLPDGRNSRASGRW